MFTYIPIHDEHLMKHGPCIVEISMSQKIGIKINNNNNNNETYLWTSIRWSALANSCTDMGWKMHGEL